MSAEKWTTCILGNQSCQYEKLFPNSIVVPVLADGRPVPIPTDQKCALKKKKNNYRQCGCRSVLTSIGGFGVAPRSSSSGACDARTAHKAHGVSLMNNNGNSFVTVRRAAILGSVLCGRRRTGSRAYCVARACACARLQRQPWSCDNNNNNNNSRDNARRCPRFTVP